MKLKCKLGNEGHHRYHLIQKDAIIAAIKWLKDNNPLYCDILINDALERELYYSDCSSVITNTADIQDIASVGATDTNHINPNI